MGRASSLLVMFLSIIPFILHVLHAGASASAASISIRQDPKEDCTLPCYPRAKFGVDSYEHQICDDPATIANITSCINNNCAGDALVTATNLLRIRCNSVGVTLSFATPSATSSTTPPDPSATTSTLGPATTSPTIIAIVSVFGGIAVLILLTLSIIMYCSRRKWGTPPAWDVVRSGDSGPGTGTGTQTSGGGGTNQAQQQHEPSADRGGTVSPGGSGSAASTHARSASGVRDRHQVDDGYYVVLRRVSDSGHPPETARRSIHEALERALSLDLNRRPPVYEQSGER